MADVFISYASAHREAMLALTEKLRAQSLSVWNDQALTPDGKYGPQITEALDEARAVVVLWSDVAAASDWVHSEANRAREQGKLINILPKDFPARAIPQPFDMHHAEGIDSLDDIVATIANVAAERGRGSCASFVELYERAADGGLLDPKIEPIAAGREPGPADLLLARSGLVEFDDANGVKARLLDWALADGPKPRGRLILGPGGLGKTRLAIELARTLRDDHRWSAGFVDEPRPEHARLHEIALHQLIRPTPDTRGRDDGLLLVFDYAETRGPTLIRLTRDLPRDAAKHPRITEAEIHYFRPRNAGNPGRLRPR